VPPVQKIELINLRVAAIESKVNRPLQLEGGRKAWVPGSATRAVWLPGASEAVVVPVLSREAMRRDTVIEGPALVEDASSTLWIPDGAAAVVDRAGNLIVDLQAGEQQAQRGSAQAEQVHQP
jgi:N-methylhydantoinase A